MRIFYTKTVKYYLSDLTEILYYKNYFGFRESAKEYIRLLRTEIETTIHLKVKREAPVCFSRYGTDLYYICCRRNKHTT